MLALVAGPLSTPSVLLAGGLALPSAPLDDVDRGTLDTDSSLDEVSYPISWLGEALGLKNYQFLKEYHLGPGRKAKLHAESESGPENTPK